jgi:hypothetical protein
MEKSKSPKFDIIFVGLAKDCNSSLNFFFKHIKKISDKYKVKLVLGENQSVDYTFDTIFKNKYSLDIDFVDTTFIEKFSNRILRLGKARQAIKNYIKDKNISARYLVVIDLDDVLKNKNISDLVYEMIFLLEKNKKNYFCVAAKSDPYYYDILNFDSDEFPNNNILDLMEDKSIFSYNQRLAKIYKLQKILTQKKSFDANSAFNGICIYFFKDYIAADYIINDESKVIPEHLNFNLQIKKKTNKKILVSNDIILNMPNEHAPLFNIYAFVKSKIKKYI